ncbi:hypothetical protein HPB50_019927 [Hyalomma asiaticum]|uniref:Uncharacterized protein n=1 Tax=Hyalomma asiaticum TaxID=266040 RepID=A0ACB7RK94_HYAAI|nr:hypothetical protein HPB50_019927 [Hyalomma asiaticum]
MRVLFAAMELEFLIGSVISAAGWYVVCKWLSRRLPPTRFHMTVEGLRISLSMGDPATERRNSIDARSASLEASPGPETARAIETAGDDHQARGTALEPSPEPESACAIENSPSDGDVKGAGDNELEQSLLPQPLSAVEKSVRAKAKEVARDVATDASLSVQAMCAVATAANDKGAGDTALKPKSHAANNEDKDVVIDAALEASLLLRTTSAVSKAANDKEPGDTGLKASQQPDAAGRILKDIRDTLKDAELERILQSQYASVLGKAANDKDSMDASNSKLESSVQPEIVNSSERAANDEGGEESKDTEFEQEPLLDCASAVKNAESDKKDAGVTCPA